MYERYCVPHFRMAGMATADKPVTVPSTMIPRYTDSTECSSRTKEPILVVDSLEVCLKLFDHNKSWGEFQVVTVIGNG